MDMEWFAKVARYIRHPVVLMGFVFAVLASALGGFLSSDRLTPTLTEDTGRILLTVVWVLGVVAALTIILGFVLAHRRARPALDADTIFRRIEEHGRKEARWDQERSELTRRNAELETTVRQLVEQSQSSDSPPGLAEALAEAGRTGDASGVVALLTRHAEALAADARSTNKAAAANLRQAATLAQWTDTRAALAAICRATELDPDDIVAWIERGRLEMQAGDRADAHRTFATALERAKAAGDERLEEVLLNEIGDVRVAQGDRAGALRAYEAGLTIAQRLASRDPENAEWQRDLSVSHNKIGEVRVAQGDRAGALRAYEAALAIREHLAARDPENAEWQRDRFASYWRIAAVHAEMPDGRGEALGWYRRAMGVVEAQTAAGKWAPVDEPHVERLRGLIAGLEAEEGVTARP